MNKILVVMSVVSLLCFGLGVDSDAGGPMAKSQIMAYKADQLIGVPIWSERGEALGKVTDLIIDEEGRVTLVVLDLVGKEDFGKERYVAVPFGSLLFSRTGAHETTVYLNLSKDELRSVPNFDRADDVISQEWVADVYRSFGQRPSWTEQAEVAPAKTWWEKESEQVRLFGGGGGAP